MVVARVQAVAVKKLMTAAYAMASPFIHGAEVRLVLCSGAERAERKISKRCWTGSCGTPAAAIQAQARPWSQHRGQGEAEQGPCRSIGHSCLLPTRPLCGPFCAPTRPWASMHAQGKCWISSRGTGTPLAHFISKEPRDSTLSRCWCHHLEAESREGAREMIFAREYRRHHATFLKAPSVLVVSALLTFLKHLNPSPHWEQEPLRRYPFS